MILCDALINSLTKRVWAGRLFVRKVVDGTDAPTLQILTTL